MKKYTRAELQEAWSQIHDEIAESQLDAQRLCTQLSQKYPGQVRFVTARLPSYSPQRYTPGPPWLPQYYIEVQHSEYDTPNPDLVNLMKANRKPAPRGLGTPIDHGCYVIGPHGETYWVQLTFYSAHASGY